MRAALTAPSRLPGEQRLHLANDYALFQQALAGEDVLAPSAMTRRAQRGSEVEVNELVSRVDQLYRRTQQAQSPLVRDHGERFHALEVDWEDPASIGADVEQLHRLVCQ